MTIEKIPATAPMSEYGHAHCDRADHYPDAPTMIVDESDARFCVCSDPDCGRRLLTPQYVLNGVMLREIAALSIYVRASVGEINSEEADRLLEEVVARFAPL